MKVLMIILLGLPGTPDPGVPQSFQLESSYGCDWSTNADLNVHVFDMKDADGAQNEQPVHSSFCYNATAAKIDQFGNLETHFTGAKAAFMAVFDKRITTQKAGVQFFYTPSFSQCETRRDDYQDHIGKLLGLADNAAAYPPAACIQLTDKTINARPAGTTTWLTHRLVIATDVLDPATAQFWVLPIENLKACLAAKSMVTQRFEQAAAQGPIKSGMHRPKISLSCIEVFDPENLPPMRSKKLSGDAVMLSGIVTDHGRPIPGRPAVIQVPIRNMDRCATAAKTLHNDFSTAQPDAADAGGTRTQLALACIPLHESASTQ